MYIPIFKNEDVFIETREISPNILKIIQKNKKESLIPNLKTALNLITGKVFSFELDDVGIYKKVFGLNVGKKMALFCVDNQNIINYNVTDGFDFSPWNSDDNTYSNKIVVFDDFKELITKKISKISFAELSPYLLNKRVAEIVKKLFYDQKNDIGNIFVKLDSFLFFKYSNMYKKEGMYFISYLKNRLFNYVDKELFKELYSYYLHFENTQIYNILKKVPQKVYNNFMRFKKENNFLSMYFADQNKTVIHTYLSNYDTVIEDIAIGLKIKPESIQPLLGCSYNDFLYIKTPQKYFNILQKFNLTITKKLNLDQINFLNELVYKNNTFVKSTDIEKILYDEALIQRFLKVFKIRKALKLTHIDKVYYDNIESYIKETIDKFNEYIEGRKTIKNIFRRVNTPYETVLNDKKIKLLPADKEIILDSIQSFVMENKKSFSNLQYWESILSQFKNKSYDDSNKYLFIFKENRQEHIVVINISDKTISFSDEMVTPRISKLLKDFFKQPEFLEYVFNNIIFEKKYCEI